jgi:flavin reductase (DIM6/NTAB) family NADH-FMN oxidoreductase RutF
MTKTEKKTMVWIPQKMDEQQRYSALMRAIVPRPVILISTIGADGIANAAPFSSCAPVCHNPPMFCFSVGLRKGQLKDTARNIHATRCFVLNSMNENMVDLAVLTAKEFPPEVDEIKEAKLTALPSKMVAAPRIAECEINIECKLVHDMKIGETHSLFIGEVVCFHVKKEILAEDGKIDPHRFLALGRLSGDYYCRTCERIFRERTWGMGKAIDD